MCLHRPDRLTVRIRFRHQVCHQCQRWMDTRITNLAATHHRTRERTLLPAIPSMTNSTMPIEEDIRRILLRRNSRQQCTIQCLDDPTTQGRTIQGSTLITRVIQIKAITNIPTKTNTPTQTTSSTHRIRINPIECIRRLIQNLSVLKHLPMHLNKDRHLDQLALRQTTHMVDTCLPITCLLGLFHLDHQRPLL